MSYPRIYICHIPETISARRLLRSRALELHTLLSNTRDTQSQLVVLNIPLGHEYLDVLLARQNVLIAANMYHWPQAIRVPQGMPWREKLSGAVLNLPDGHSPLQHVAALRNALRIALRQSWQQSEIEARALERMIGAVVAMPELHPDSEVQLDIDDHQQRLKLLGLNELPGLVAMAGASWQLSESALHSMIVEQLHARLWHDGSKLLFELVSPRFQLRLLGDDLESCAALPLLEGENIIGRRRATQASEYRHSIADDLVSNDHALIYCEDGDQLRLRDMSKNGTWLAIPGESEEYIHHQEHMLQVGMKIRVGITRMRVERIET